MVAAARSRETQVEAPARRHPRADRPDEPKYGSDALVDQLREFGAKYVPLNPGSSFRGLHDSLVNYNGNRDPQLLLCLHEEIAVALAHGYAKAARTLGVAAVHDLVGLMHASMAVYNAFCDRTSLLILGGSGPADPSLRRSTDWLHSSTTQSEIVRDFVVWHAEPATVAAAVADISRAGQRALSTPTGPAYVSLDSGMQESRLDQPPHLPDASLRLAAPPFAPSPACLERAARLISEAERPVVVAGRVGLDPAVTPLLVELVEVVGACYLDDRNFVAFPTLHPQNCSGDDDLLTEADVVLAVDVVDLPALLRGRSRRRDAAGAGTASTPAIIDLSPGDLGLHPWSNAFAAPLPRAVQLLSDPLLGLAQLTQTLRTMVASAAADVRRERATARASDVRDRQRALVDGRWDDPTISPARLVGETWRAVRECEWLLCLRNTRTWPHSIWEFGGAGQYLGHSGGGGLGYGPGAMVGGALAARDRGQIGVGIIGDGDLVMAAGALWTAVHYQIPLLMVVNDNSSFYNDEAHQSEIARHRGRAAQNSWIGMRMTQPRIDIAGLARSYGCWASDRVTEPSRLAPALQEGLGRALAGQAAIIDVQVAPE